MDCILWLATLTIIVLSIMGVYAILFHFAPCGIEVEGLGFFEVCRECGGILIDGKCKECEK